MGRRARGIEPRVLHKAGSIPSTNTLVDIGNLVSIRHALPVAMFDQASVTGDTTVRPATGAERFTDLATIEAQHEGGRIDVEAAMNELVELLHRFQPSVSAQVAFLDATTRSVDF